jgi:3-deoxy-7-phosphoheptulonate synthase
VAETGFTYLREQASDLLGNSRKSRPFDLVLGPCAIESDNQIGLCAEAAAKLGASYLRGGVIKLRTNYRSFTGLGPEGWILLTKTAKQYGLKTISEITQPYEFDEGAYHLDALQIGARSMWNFELFHACADSGKTVILKRGFGATTSEWLAAAARLKAYGCDDLILCERGARSFDPCSRNSVDLSTLLFLTTEIDLPIWIDASHSSGDPKIAQRVIEIAPNLGVSGVMAEIHPQPSRALCDGYQAIALSDLSSLSVPRPRSS